MHSIESRFVIGPSNILFAGVYEFTFQPGQFTERQRETERERDRETETERWRDSEAVQHQGILLE